MKIMGGKKDDKKYLKPYGWGTKVLESMKMGRGNDERSYLKPQKMKGKKIAKVLE